MNLAEIWRRLTTTRYTRALEVELALERAVVTRLDTVIAQQGIEIDKQDAEISRLRAENRALLNSILGIAGVPPVSASLDDLAATQSQNATPPSVARARIQPRTSPRQRAAVPGRKSTAASNSIPRKKKSPPRIRYRRPITNTAH
jgi:uncharacterized coiled-coil protein SlyX